MVSKDHPKLSLTTVIAAQKISISNRKAEELTLNQKLMIVAITKCAFLYYKCVRFVLGKQKPGLVLYVIIYGTSGTFVLMKSLQVLIISIE